MENEDKKKGIQALVTFQRELTKQVDEVKGNLSVLDKDNDFMGLPNERQMEYLAIMLDRLEDERKQTFLWLQGYANKYDIALDYSKFEDNYDVFKDDIKPYQEQCNYFLDLANIAIMVKLKTQTNELKIRSKLMREELNDFLYDKVLNIGFMNLPKRVDKVKLKQMFDKYINIEMPQPEKEFVKAIKTLFQPRQTKASVVSWLYNIILEKPSKDKAGAFIYDIMYNMGYVHKQYTGNKEKSDYVKSYL